MGHGRLCAFPPSAQNVPSSRIRRRTFSNGSEAAMSREARNCPTAYQIRILPNRGPVVISMTPEEVRELYEVRSALEGVAAFRAAERLTSEQLDRLAAGRRGDDEGAKPRRLDASSPATSAVLRDFAGSVRQCPASGPARSAQRAHGLAARRHPCETGAGGRCRGSSALQVSRKTFNRFGSFFRLFSISEMNTLHLGYFFTSSGSKNIGLPFVNDDR